MEVERNDLHSYPFPEKVKNDHLRPKHAERSSKVRHRSSSKLNELFVYIIRMRFVEIAFNKLSS